jgi:hypothetical protein
LLVHAVGVEFGVDGGVCVILLLHGVG